MLSAVDLLGAEPSPPGPPAGGSGAAAPPIACVLGVRDTMFLNETSLIPLTGFFREANARKSDEQF